LDTDLLVWQQDAAEDEFYQFADETSSNKAWKILIVDDEKIIHQATKKALLDFSFEGKRLHFLHAHNKAEAQTLIRQYPDTAVIFLDVMMDGEKSGLEVVSYIRKTLKNRFVRIILRTGQPQEAPEEAVIHEYDINDYREKTEMTARKLYTILTASLRAYRDIMLIESNKRALERILASSSLLLEAQTMHKLAGRVLHELRAILRLNAVRSRNGISGLIATKDTNADYYVLAATDDCPEVLNHPINELFSACTLEIFKNGHLGNDQYSKFFYSKHGHESFIYFNGVGTIDEWEDNLIEILMLNVSIAIDNMYLNKEIEETQKEIIFTLGEFSEARSKETSNHVKRVAEYSKLLALKYGLSEEDAELLRLASPMHDVGKLGITDTILNKPGRLSEDEFEIIKSHGTLGYEILKNSSRKIMQTGAIIALQHHEKYNGSGYPQGLRGEEIHIFGRITAIADVFDALGSDRIYKKAWPLDQILAYFEKEKGSHFDPALVDIFLANLPEFLAIRDRLTDSYSVAV
jgi:response regulator RpfG family c-di-GMP phosphodiesterase